MILPVEDDPGRVALKKVDPGAFGQDGGLGAIFGAEAFPLRLQGKCTIHRACVEVPEAKPAGEDFRHRALARTSGAVDRDDEPHRTPAATVGAPSARR